VRLALRAARRLERESRVHARVIDLRWLDAAASGGHP